MVDIRRLLEDLDAQEMNDDVSLEGDDIDVVSEIEACVLAYDDEGNLVPMDVSANDFLVEYGISQDELEAMIKESGEPLRLFKATPKGHEDAEEYGLYIGNEACTAEDVEARFISNLGDDEEMEFDISEIVDEDEPSEEAPIDEAMNAKPNHIIKLDDVTSLWESDSNIDSEGNEYFYQIEYQEDNGKFVYRKVVDTAYLDAERDDLRAAGIKVEEIEDALKKALSEGINESKGYIYYCISDGVNPRKSIIIPDGEGAKERAIAHAEANKDKYKYVSRFEDGIETVIWRAPGFEAKGMRIGESRKVGPDNLFGYINGDLKDFDPEELIKKVKERKTSLHTNRMVKDTDDVKVCHHIVVDTLGWTEEPHVWVDVVEDTWTRNPGDPDDINSYYGTNSQERILMKDCGVGEEGFKKAIEELGKYKESELNKHMNANEALEEELEAGDCAYHPERDEYYYLKKTNRPNAFELFTYSAPRRDFVVASPRFIDKNSPFYNELKLACKNANPSFKDVGEPKAEGYVVVDGLNKPCDESCELEESKLPYHVLAWRLNEIISSMDNEEAYYGGWLYIWPDGETKEDCKGDFASKEDYEDLLDAFKRYYKAYHKDGLYTDDKRVLGYAREMDKKLGLEPIENHGKAQLESLSESNTHAIIIDKPEGKDAFEILKNAGYEVRKDTSKPLLRIIVKKDGEEREVANYGYEGDSYFFDLEPSKRIFGEGFSKADEESIKRWWKDVEALGKFDINNEGASIEEMHSAMFDVLMALAKEEGKDAKRLLARGKRLYNKHAISQFNEPKPQPKPQPKPEEAVNGEEVFWNIRDKANDAIRNKYNGENLIVDGGEIRPIDGKELENKYAVAVEHADKGDFKTREEIEEIARSIGAEKIMFYASNGQYGGEYSFLLSDKDVAEEVAKKYDQEAYAEFDEHGEYHPKQPGK